MSTATEEVHEPSSSAPAKGLEAYGDVAERDRLTLAQQESISNHIAETQVGR